MRTLLSAVAGLALLASPLVASAKAPVTSAPTAVKAHAHHVKSAAKARPAKKLTAKVAHGGRSSRSKVAKISGRTVKPMHRHGGRPSSKPVTHRK